MRHVHLIVLQHGYHGTSKDFAHLHHLLQSATAFAAEALPSVQCPDTNWSVTSNASHRSSSQLWHSTTSSTVADNRPDALPPGADGAPAGQPLSLHTVVLNLDVNDGWKTDNGVLTCGDRLIEAVMKSVRAQLPSAPPNDGGIGAQIELHLSFVGHSMGGLVIRSALPELTRQLASLTTSTTTTRETEADSPASSTTPPIAKVSWETFCCISVPHVGVTHMPSQLRATMGKLSGRLFSKGLHDLFLSSHVVTETITTEAHLKAWRRFQRRVLINTANDHTVMSYSSIFSILPEEQTILYSQHTNAHPTPATPANTDAAVAHSSAASPLPMVQTVDRLPAPATNCDELAHNGWALDSVTESLWPSTLLSHERDVAVRIVREVGPFEVHTVDFRPRYADLIAKTALPASADSPATILPEVAAQRSRRKALMAIARRGTEDWAHRAIICKGEYAELPSLFGFTGQFVAANVLGASMPSTTGAEGARVAAEPTVAPSASHTHLTAA